MKTTAGNCKLLINVIAICCIFLVSSHISLKADFTSNKPENTKQIQTLFPSRVNGLPTQEYLQSSTYIETLKKTVLDYETVYGACSTPKFKARVNIGIPQNPWSLPEIGIAPQWIEVIRISGCKDTYLRNVLVVALERGTKLFPLISGNALSLVDFTLQQDVINTLIASENITAKNLGCKNEDRIRIFTTKMMSYEHKEEIIHWNEIWTISNCKEHKELTLEFKMSPITGTEFTIHQPSTDKLIAKSNSPKIKSNQ